MKDYKIVCSLSAKDKKVYKAEKDNKIYILKEYPDDGSALKEVETAKKVALTGYAPQVIDYEGNKAVYEYIEGENFYDAFRNATMTDDKPAMELLANRLSIFLQIMYSFTNCVMKEIDFKNYIIKDGRVIGIDFSSVDNGMPYEDIASAISYALLNSVGEYYDCYPFIDKLLDCFQLKMIDIVNELNASLKKRKEKSRDGGDIEMMIDSLTQFQENGVDWHKLI